MNFVLIVLLPTLGSSLTPTTDLELSAGAQSCRRPSDCSVTQIELQHHSPSLPEPERTILFSKNLSENPLTSVKVKYKLGFKLKLMLVFDIHLNL